MPQAIGAVALSLATPAGIGGIAAVAGVGSLISHSKRRSDSADRLAREQMAESQRRTNAEIERLERQQKLDASGKEEASVRAAAKEKQRRKIASAQGRRRTILTSPLGVTGTGNSEEKKELVGT